MEKIILNVSGMSCKHCEMAVITALQDIGAEKVLASSKNNTVEVHFEKDKLSIEKIKNEITETGYVLINL